MMTALALSGGKDSMACLYLLRDELDCAIYVDTGYAYPETTALIASLADMIPLYVVSSDRDAQQAREGLPSDVVPVEWTPLGQACTHQKAVTIQPSLSCCHDNLAKPIYAKAKELGVTHLVFGQRHEETHRGPAQHGNMVEGIMRLHPIENWTTQQVMDYLATKMTIPAHYAIKHSSLDCYDCTAFAKESRDRLAWTKTTYPDLYAAYQVRADLLNSAIAEALEVA
jgi:3'-phosphoadenosine 5'-phosphosulfate sulfotransferase (PAPS reductase)/FAD synthetase